MTHVRRPHSSHKATPTWRVDLHVHTCYSDDCRTPLSEVITAATRANLGAIAITDHDAIAGALALKERAPFTVIVGEEITTSCGDLIGLFLQQWIPPGLSPAETALLIREQGGLVYAPHPFDRLRQSALGEAGLAPIMDQLDVIEVLNGRVIWSPDNDRALHSAQDGGIAAGAGSDAHTAHEIGGAYVEMDPFVGSVEFLLKLATGRIGGGISSPHVHLSSTWAKLQRR